MSVHFTGDMMEKRSITIDALKGLAAILVVVGHAIQVVYAPDHYDVNWVFKIIYTFHMPLFIFISGFLVGYKEELSVQWLWGRFKRLSIPFWVWVPVDYLIDGGRTWKGFTETVVTVWKDPSDGGLWFLWVLFLCCLIQFLEFQINHRLLGRFIKNEIMEAILSVAELIPLILLWYMVDFTTALGLRLCCKEIIFFLAGYHVNKFLQWKNESGKKIDFSCRWICYAAFPVSVPFWDRTHFVSFYAVLDQYSALGVWNYVVVSAFKVLFFYLVSFLGIGFVWGIAEQARELRINSLLAYIGQYTMEIYILHLYFFVGWAESSLINTCISIVGGICISIWTGMVVARIPVVRSILFGK